jgi:hypothetical protein
MNNRTRALLALPLLAALAACAPKGDDTTDADAFRSALPTADRVKLDTPGGASAGSTTASLSPSVKLQGDGTSPSGTAEFYQLTRTLFDGVNVGTAAVLDIVWTIAQFPPTSTQGDTYTWGPWNDSLSPAEWQLVVTQTSPDVFDYVLEGRPRNTTDAFTSTLHGTGFGKASDKYGAGNFAIDWDAANKLDPDRLGASTEDGTVSIVYDLTTAPGTIEAKVVHSLTAQSFDVTTTREGDQSGLVDLTAHTDISTPADGLFEDVTMKSRWLASGAGRADVTMSGGSLASIGTVKASECWSSTFAETYWTDSATFQPNEGSVAMCAYPDAEF